MTDEIDGIDDDPIAELREAARAQCSEGQLRAVAMCALGLSASEAEQIVERYSEVLDSERLYGQAKVLVGQYTLASHGLSKAGPAMLMHFGVQHLGQTPGGPHKEIAKLLRDIEKMSPVRRAKLLRDAAEGRA